MSEAEVELCSNPAAEIDAEVDRQTEYYDHHYRQVDVGEIVNKVRNLENYFADAVRTDTSWYGLYWGDFAASLSGRRVLELGCGDGLNALIMAAQGAQVVAIDISHESKRIIEMAAAELGYGSERILALTGDFRKLDLTSLAPFDLIVGKAFLHHLTPAQEREYLAKIARLLRPDGQARFFEPAVNSPWMDALRWMIPMGRRPSALRRTAFAAWKARDPHPDRCNSTRAYLAAANQFFGATEAIPIGSLERFHRLLRRGDLERAYRRWAHRVDRRLPYWFRSKFARSQTLIYRRPHPAEAAQP